MPKDLHTHTYRHRRAHTHAHTHTHTHTHTHKAFGCGVGVRLTKGERRERGVGTFTHISKRSPQHTMGQPEAFCAGVTWI